MDYIEIKDKIRGVEDALVEFKNTNPRTANDCWRKHKSVLRFWVPLLLMILLAYVSKPLFGIENNYLWILMGCGALVYQAILIALNSITIDDLRNDSPDADPLHRKIYAGMLTPGVEEASAKVMELLDFRHQVSNDPQVISYCQGVMDELERISAEKRAISHSVDVKVKVIFGALIALDIAAVLLL